MSFAEATSRQDRTRINPHNAPEQFRRHWDELRPRLDGLYLSFETDDRPARLSDAFPGLALARLRRLKAAYDPANVFNANFPIPPARFAA